MSTWIQTASGGRFDLAAPRAADVRMGDVAHALSNLCRFGGHVRRFYSVAQHSVLVWRVLEHHDLEVQRAALLHDAAEAYVGDVVSPLKRRLEGYRPLEDLVLRVIFESAGVPFPGADVWALVRGADLRALMTERRDLLPAPPVPWVEDERGAAPWPEPIDPLPPIDAGSEFGDAARALGLWGQP